MPGFWLQGPRGRDFSVVVDVASGRVAAEGRCIIFASCPRGSIVGKLFSTFGKKRETSLHSPRRPGRLGGFPLCLQSSFASQAFRLHCTHRAQAVKSELGACALTHSFYPI